MDGKDLLNYIKTIGIDKESLSELDTKVVRFIGDSSHLGSRDVTPREYSRSRDALKAIRPTGYSISGAHQTHAGKFKGFCLSPGKIYKPGPDLPTEELAELYAIIEAIEYEKMHS